MSRITLTHVMSRLLLVSLLWACAAVWFELSSWTGFLLGLPIGGVTVLLSIHGGLPRRWVVMYEGGRKSMPQFKTHAYVMMRSFPDAVYIEKVSGFCKRRIYRDGVIIFEREYKK